MADEQIDRVLIADDEADIHAVTKLTLSTINDCALSLRSFAPLPGDARARPRRDPRDRSDAVRGPPPRDIPSPPHPAAAKLYQNGEWKMTLSVPQKRPAPETRTDATIVYDTMAEVVRRLGEEPALAAAHADLARHAAYMRDRYCSPGLERIDGEVSMSCEDGLEPAEKAAGFVLSCVACPKTSVVLDL